MGIGDKQETVTEVGREIEHTNIMNEDRTLRDDVDGGSETVIASDKEAQSDNLDNKSKPGTLEEAEWYVV